MNVGTIRELLSDYRDDDELFIMFWDAHFIKAMLDADISSDEWSTIIDRTEGIEDWVSSEVYEFFETAVEQVLIERTN